MRHRFSFLLIFFIIVSITGCRKKPEKIEYGKDNCAECKMTIMDPHFGGEIITKKGRIYKFDDTHCIAQFLKRRGVELASIHRTLFTDYEKAGEFLEVEKSEFVLSHQFTRPMGGNAAAFSSKQGAEKKSSELP